MQPVSPIAPSGSTTFTITFDPSAEGIRTASISIANNDTNENPYTFSVQGLAGNYPEMEIKGNAITILDGDSTPSLTDYTNFGSTPVSNGSISRTFTIYNTGNGDLDLTDSPKVTLSGAHAGDFSVTMQPSSPITPSGSTTFTIVFDPSAGGLRTASVSIANTDSDENPYNFSIQGTGTVFPEIDIQGNNTSIPDGDTTPSLTDYTDFGAISVVSGTASRTFTIYNVGDANLTLTGSPKVYVTGTNSSDFTVSVQPSTPIVPGGSVTFTIVFNPSASGIRNASISIYSNDSNENPYDFSIRGTGTPTVSTIVRADSNPTHAANVDFIVTFSESVINVDTSDFALATTGITGASVTGVTGTGSTRTVSVNTGSGSGTIRLDIPVTATITNLTETALGGLPYNNGETYTNVYTLAINTVGNGSVAPDPLAPYHYGDVVQLTTTADTGWTFAGWGGACSGSGACNITMDDNKSVTATFILNTYTISGNAGVAGATITYTGGSTVTDGVGDYSFTVIYDWTGTVTPSKTGYTFTPVSKSYTNVTADQSTQDYAAALNTYTISGNAGVAGTTITYTGGSTSADGAGDYSFNVTYGWTGTMTPSKTGYTFAPVNKSYSNVTTNQTAQDYTAELNSYTISGNAGVAGATITYTGGSTTADGSGDYSFTVTYGWTGTATPFKTGYTFTPVSKSYANVTANQTTQDYTAALIPPTAFNKTSPTNGAINQSVNATLSWEASTWATSYEYCYDTTNDSACSSWMSNGASTSKSLSGLLPNTTYYWHVRAANAVGTVYANGSGTAFWSFKTATAPAAFNKTSPATNAIKQPTNPILTWGASTGAAGYEYCYDTSNNNLCDTSWISTTGTSVTLSGLTNNAAYYWQVRAVSLGGFTVANANAWWNFKVVIAPPNTTAPGNVIPGAADNIHTKRPAFAWDAVPGATSYTVEVVKPAYCSAFSTKAINATASTNSYTPTTDLTANTVYCWRVKANGTNGPSSYSQVRTFTTGNPPSVPALSAPANNTLVTTTLRPLFDWANSTLPTGTVFDKYEFQIDTSSTFATATTYYTTPGNITNSDWTPPADLTRATAYYWRVRSWNTAGDFSGWSAVWAAKITYAAPTLVSPTNGSTATSLKPTFTWNVALGATSYKIQVSAYPNFSTMLVNAMVTTASYAPAVNLTAHKTLYWRVQALGTYGPSTWSTVWTFITP